MISVEPRRLGTNQLLADGHFRNVDVIGIPFTFEIKFDGFAEICCGFFACVPKTGNIDTQALSDEVRLLLVQAILYCAHTASLP